jgi:phosphate starvation-inducible PhoH-like protein
MAKKKTNTQASFTETVFHFKPANPTQIKVSKDYPTHDLIFLTGPAGTGKTHCALACALQELLAGNKKQILVVRPIVEVGDTLGFLPGSVDEKISPYFDPIRRLIKRLTYKLPEEAVLFQPLSYMRGDTFEDCVLFLDEAQNATYSQLKMFLTRVGNNSKVLISCDPEQTDVKPHNPDKFSCDILSVMKRLSSLTTACTHVFKEEESLRHPLVREVLKRL